MKEKVSKSEEFLKGIIDDVIEAEVIHVPEAKLNGVKDSITNKNIEFKLRNTTKEQRTNWAELTEAMGNEHAERFNLIVEGLATTKPLEYVRVYLKALEFFQPKLVRTDGSEGVVKDNEIVVIIKR